jgi:hypothetical protein
VSFKEPAIPESIGRCADLYHDVRDLRLAMAKEVEEVEAFERRVKQHIIDNLSKSEDSGAAGLRYRAQRVEKEVPRVVAIVDGDEDTAAGWQRFWDYVAKTRRFDLIQKRLADKAVKEMWEAGEVIPGVERFKSVDVSITKI